MWKYSLAAVVGVVSLQAVGLLLLKTFTFGTSLFQAAMVAWALAWWFAHTRHRAFSPTERKQLLWQYSVLVTALFVLMGAVWGSTHTPNIAEWMLFVSNWVPYPLLMYRATGEVRMQAWLSPAKQTGSSSRSRYFRTVFYLLKAQFALGILLALFTPDDILKHAWASNWVRATLGAMAPRMLIVPPISSVPQVVMFLHATMLATWPLFAIPAVLIILLAPKPATNEIKLQTTRIISKSTLVIGYFLVAILLSALMGIWLSGNASYHYGKYGSIDWLSRSSLVIASTTWVITTSCLCLIATAPGVLKMYWNISPWFSPKTRL